MYKATTDNCCRTFWSSQFVHIITPGGPCISILPEVSSLCSTTQSDTAYPYEHYIRKHHSTSSLTSFTGTLSCHQTMTNRATFRQLFVELPPKNLLEHGAGNRVDHWRYPSKGNWVSFETGSTLPAASGLITTYTCSLPFLLLHQRHYQSYRLSCSDVHPDFMDHELFMGYNVYRSAYSADDV